MKMFQELKARCSCEVCKAGCMCGDCARCSNPVYDRMLMRNVKRISALACLAIILGGFVYFAPVVTLGATPTVTETFSMKVRQSGSPSAPMGSISFCLFGDGAVLLNDTYYPTVAADQNASRLCKG